MPGATSGICRPLHRCHAILVLDLGQARNSCETNAVAVRTIYIYIYTWQTYPLLYSIYLVSMQFCISSIGLSFNDPEHAGGYYGSRPSSRGLSCT